MTTIYRAEVIGSMLRPASLQDARKAWEAGTLSTPEFKRVEDRAVDEAIALQEAAGLDIVTDGELRRTIFTGTLTDAIDGLSRVPATTHHWYGHTAEKEVPAEKRLGMAPAPVETSSQPGETPEEMDFKIPFSVTSKIRRVRSLATEEFAYARGKTNKPLKMTLPSPFMMTFWWSPEHSTAAYSDPFALFTDAVDILRQEVRELASLGCQYIQIDAPEVALLVDPTTRRTFFEASGVSTERMLGEGIEMLNALVDAPGVTFGLHLCRGNNRGHWMSQGGYEVISKQVFKRATKYDVFLLEYDDWRSGSFEALADIPRDKIAVLGLVSSKKKAIEPTEGILARIEEASRYFPREQLALSTQCGFASVILGNPIDEAAQKAKLQLVANVAHRVWA